MQNISGGMLEDDLPTVTGIDALYVVPPTSRKSVITSAQVANVEDKQKLSAEEISSSVFRPSESLATRGDGGDRGGSQLLHVSQSCSSPAPIPNHYSKSSISSSDSCSSSRKKASHLPLCYRANQDDCYQESPRNSSCSAVFEKRRCTSMVMSNASNASVSGVIYRDRTVTSDNDNHQHHYYWNPFPSASDGDSFPYAARSPCSPDALLGAYADAGRSAPHAARLASSKWDDAEKWLTANINGCRGFTANSLRSLGKSCHARTMPSPSIESNHHRPPHKSTKLRSSSNMQRAHPSFAWSNEQSRALNASCNSLSHDAHQYGVVTYSPNHMFANNGDPMITRHVARCMIDAGTCGTSISPNHHCHGRALAAEAVRCTSCGGLRWATPCNFNPGNCLSALAVDFQAADGNAVQLVRVQMVKCVCKCPALSNSLRTPVSPSFHITRKKEVFQVFEKSYSLHHPLCIVQYGYGTTFTSSTMHSCDGASSTEAMELTPKVPPWIS